MLLGRWADSGCDQLLVCISLVNPLHHEGFLSLDAFHASLKIRDKWICAVINCLLDVVRLFEKTQAGADGCCHWLELPAQIWHY